MSLELPLVWVDLEMTGLDPNQNVIVEIAAIVTDGALETIIEGPDLVLGASERDLAAMEDVVVQMHADSGLTEAIRASSLTVPDAEAQILEFVRQHVPEERTAPVAGNSIGTDRVFLRAFMPTLDAHLHYRSVDVSSIKELVRRWYPPEVLDGAPVKGGAHRALADIRESIEELRYYREQVFCPR